MQRWWLCQTLLKKRRKWVRTPIPAYLASQHSSDTTTRRHGERFSLLRRKDARASLRGSRCLHDIVVQNAKLRQEAAHGALDLTGIEERVDAVLTDEVRAAFTQTLQKARAEMDKARELDRSAEEFLQTVLVDQAAMLHKGKSPTATPTAPKAMRQQQQQHPGKRALEDVLSSPPRTRLRRSPSLQSNASYAQRRSPSPRDKRYRSPEYERERRYRSHSKERRRDRSRDPYYRERHRSREKERSKERSRDRSREPYHSRNGDERRERYRSRERDRSYDSRYPRTKYPSARSPYARYPSPSGFYNRSYITNTSEVPYRSQHHDLPQSHPQSSSQSQSQSGSPHIHPRPPSLPRSAKAYSPAVDLLPVMIAIGGK
ncbi:hypothetical protein BDZ89DRAFT_332219 [Hymenopellis radicata]|nr:hypothetical protein BDZ89DRAFT_332219 [Hymenopellis radicata]